MIDRQRVKNIMFDLGGVVTNLNRQRCVDAFLKLGVSDIDSLLGLYVQSGIFKKLESGELEVDAFHDKLRQHCGLPLLDEQIDNALMLFIEGIPLSRLQALEQLHHSYALYVLSNTNPIMFPHIIAQEFKKDGHDMNYYFDSYTISYEAGYNKPEKGIFDYAVSHMGIKPEETLFLDDSPTNVDAAATYGFQALLVAPGTEFMEILDKQVL